MNSLCIARCFHATALACQPSKPLAATTFKRGFHSILFAFRGTDSNIIRSRSSICKYQQNIALDQSSISRFYHSSSLQISDALRSTNTHVLLDRRSIGSTCIPAYGVLTSSRSSLNRGYRTKQGQQAPPWMPLSQILSTTFGVVPQRSIRELPCLSSVYRFLSSKMSTDDVLRGFDETQVKLMEEECILVDEHDKNIGSASKKTCHLLQNINKGMLHRAFSVFLFNTKGQLLLQQRAEAKITFPDHFTNTCCSHPLNFEAELEEKEAIGVKRAAQRKLKHELGIEPEEIPLDDFHYLTRILYKAENIPKDNKWGEHEIDYILFIQKDVNVVPNPNEVKSYRYVSQDDLKNLMNTASTDGLLITPWFRLIVQTFLYGWWNNLNDLENHTDRNTVHNMVKSS